VLKKKLMMWALILGLVLMPLTGWGEGVELGVKTESGLYLEFLLVGQDFIAPENGYFVNEPWMEEADLALIELEEYEAELDTQVNKGIGGKIFWYGIGFIMGVVIAK